MKTLQFRAMNTDILLAAEGPADQLEEGVERAEQFIHESEARFSRFSEASELSALNRSTGSWFQASADLYEVIALARRFYHVTQGLFDPAILPDLRRAGYDRSLEVVREEGASPLFESLMSGEHRRSFSELELDEANLKIWLPAGVAIDLGGIAKGWIAEQAAIILSGYSTTCAVNAGGDMFLVGLPEGETCWTVELEDPFQPENTLTKLQVDPGAVATSSITKRTWKQGEKERHHLIDPRTGEPALTQWVSVTVATHHAHEAEVFAKALLIAGPQEAENILRRGGMELSYVAVDWDRKLWGNHERREEADYQIKETAYVH